MMAEAEPDGDEPNAEVPVDPTAAGPETELQPKRTTSFAKRFKNKKKPDAPAGNDLAARIAAERERTKYWAKVLLLFPLVPVLAAFTTIMFGGVIINVAHNQCNSDLMVFLRGAVALSYLLVAFYAYCWIGPWPIKRLRTVRFFYLIYGLLCFIWWGIYGTLQAATATSTGFQSCLSTSPALFIMAQYEIVVFWCLFLLFIGWVVMERTAEARDLKLAERQENRLQALRDKVKANHDAQEAEQKAAEEQARRAAEEERRKLAEEQDQLFRDSENDEDPTADNQQDNDLLLDEDLDDYTSPHADAEAAINGDDEGGGDGLDDDDEVVVVGVPASHKKAV